MLLIDEADGMEDGDHVENVQTGTVHLALEDERWGTRLRCGRGHRRSKSKYKETEKPVSCGLCKKFGPRLSGDDGVFLSLHRREKERLRVAADAHGVSMIAFIRMALSHHLPPCEDEITGRMEEVFGNS